MAVTEGALLATVAMTARPRLARSAVAVLAIAMLPSQLWMGQLARHTQQIADQTALGVAVGVLATTQPLGETLPEEVTAALPSLRARQAAMYAWPQTRLLGRVPGRDEGTVIAARNWQVQPVENRLDGPGAHVTFAADTPAQRLVIVDAGGRAIGLAVPDRGTAPHGWSGWVRGDIAAAGLRVIAIASD
ncbi:hypothetical protein ACFOLC_10520 [Lysobacter cavernae]|uniref:Uncharacterized protein n=1 Tax=Lysobacter cavernae TaxID=1685901 RepID=A0ABV7RRU9_9GAMM